MKNILYLWQLEWLKNRHYRPFFVLLGMYMLFLPIFSLLAHSITFPAELNVLTLLYTFPNVFDFVGYVGSWFVFFIFGFLIILSVTNEFEYRTLRQTILNGWSRAEFFQSKLVFIVALCSFATLYYALVCLIIGFFHTETVFTSRITQKADLILRFFMMCLSYSSIALFLGILIRRTGLTLFFYFAYSLFLEKPLRYLVIGKILGDTAHKFLPANVTADLVPLPFGLIKILDLNGFDQYFLPTYQAMVAATLWLIIWGAGSYFLIKKRDL